MGRAADRRDIRDLVHFGEDAPRRALLYETERLWSDVVCLQGAQRLGPIADADADAIVAVLAGTVSMQVGRSRARSSQWESVLVPAGEELTVANASEEPSVLLVVTAPPPRRLDVG